MPNCALFWTPQVVQDKAAPAGRTFPSQGGQEKLPAVWLAAEHVASLVRAI